MSHNLTDTIIALSTPPGAGAIGVIRLSGPQAIEVVNEVFHGKDLSQEEGYTVHFGKIKDEEGKVLDEVLATIFRSPFSRLCHQNVFISRKK